MGFIENANVEQKHEIFDEGGMRKFKYIFLVGQENI